MKEPSKLSQSHSKSPQIKLLCSFNGVIQNLSQHSEKLRYVGGETRLLALDRGVGISQLLSKISELQPRCSSFCIKYLLPEPECAGDRPLVSVDTDEDVRCMIEEHERIEAEGKGMRIRIFICDGRKSYPYSKKESPTKFPVWAGGLSGNPQCRIKNHRVGPTNIKNQRIVSYNVQNRQNNPNDLGNPRVHLLHGKPCHCALLRPKGGILKVGQVKPRHAHLGKSCHGIQVDPTQGIQPLLNVGISSGIMHSSDGGAPVDFLCAQCDILGKEYGNLNIHRSCLHCCARSCGFSDCRCLSIRMGYYPNLHYNGNKVPIPCSGAIDIKEESACYSEVVNTEIQCRPIFNKPLFNDNQFTNVREKDRVICITNRNRKGSLDSVVSDSSQTDVDPNSGLESIYNIKHSPHTWKVQMKGEHENGEVVAEQLTVGDDGTNDNSLLDLSMKNLSLSSSLEVAPSVSASSGLGGSLCSNPLPEHEVNSPSNQMDLWDKKLPSRSPPTEHFTEVGIHTSEALTNIAAQVSQRVGKGHANDNEKETILSRSNLQEKIHLKGSVRSSKVVGGTGSSLPVVYNHLATPELQCIKNSDLEEIRELGTGTYGTVFYGKWRGCDVAIKRIKPSCFTGGELGDKDRLVSDFWKEANLLGQLHHPNVLAFYGVVSDGPVTQLATITEYMVNGSLKQVLKKNDRTIDRRKRIIIAMDAAFGMEYLHEKNIVHFDLKSHNFLVNMRDPLRPICKIGDLGLSKVKQKTMVSGGVRGTIPWMAPELLTSKKCMVSEKVDVYSFGIVMWELLNGKEPYSDMRSEEIIAGVLKGDLRPEIPSWCEPQWRSLMERCWSTDPNSRPSFSKIAKELRVIAAGANIK